MEEIRILNKMTGAILVMQDCRGQLMCENTPPKLKALLNQIELCSRRWIKMLDEHKSDIILARGDMVQS